MSARRGRGERRSLDLEQMGEELLPINRSRCLTVVAAVSVVAEWARGPRDKPRKGGHAARALPLGVWTGCMGTGGVWLCLCAVIKKKKVAAESVASVPLVPPATGIWFVW